MISTKSISSNVDGGIGFFGLLTIVFVIWKLTGEVSWSWLWVLSPIMIFTSVLLFFFLALIGSMFIKYSKE